MTPKMKEALDAVEKCGGNVSSAARMLGISRGAMRERITAAKRWDSLDPAIQDHLKSRGYDNVNGLHSGWLIRKDEDGTGESLYFQVGGGAEDVIKVEDLLRDAIEDAFEEGEPYYEARDLSNGDNLLVVDLADVHVGKLCVESETGYTYNRDVAVHRMREGTAQLLHLASGHGIGRILFVVGNDVLHCDTPRSTTTSGTYQDSDGTIQTMYSDAFAAYITAIEQCAQVAPVDLIFAPSNHDWVMGWALVQAVGAWFNGHPTVNASEYNISVEHRKYYRYENNLIGITHGDGAKEADLYPLMVTEARMHISDCKHLHWYVHHLHHKIRKNVGVRNIKREKDLIGMTVVSSGEGDFEGGNCKIETVRSPSPPDGWHSRNGYINRQAVECFVHHPQNGQFARFTCWF